MVAIVHRLGQLVLFWIFFYSEISTCSILKKYKQKKKDGKSANCAYQQPVIPPAGIYLDNQLHMVSEDEQKRAEYSGIQNGNKIMFLSSEHQKEGNYSRLQRLI